MLSSNQKIQVRMKIVIFLVLIPLLIYLIVGLYFLQIKNHDKFYKRAKNIYTTSKKNSGKRGEIYTKEGSLLVGNRPCVNIIADPSLMTLNDGVARKIVSVILSKYIGQSYSTIYKKLSPIRPKYDSKGNPIRDKATGEIVMRSSKYVVLARNVNLELAATIKKELEINSIRRSIYYENTYKRTYTKGTLLANILGFTIIDGDSQKALFGIERIVNDDIAPSQSKDVFEIGRDGQKLNYGLSEHKEVKDGKNIYLTINETLQSIVEEELDKAMKDWNANAVYAVMVEPKTGNIMAIGQRPTFNPNDRKTIKPENTRCRIISDVMEPGSIIKPFTIAYAIDNKYVTPNTIIDCEKSYWIYRGKPLTDTHDVGKVTVTELLKQSSNIGTAKIAIALGENNVYNNLRNFGFGQKTGIPLTPESSGLMSPVKKWDGLTISRMPIGYSISTTSIQMARAYAALANGGMLLPLRLIDRIEDPETKEVTMMPYQDGVPVFKDKETSKTMAFMLAQVARKGGTARRASMEDFSVAGKTGTSRKFINGQYSRKHFFASFAGFVPAEKPEFVLVITVDEPKGHSYYGGTVSGPIFKAISEKSLKALNIDPTKIERFKTPEELANEVNGQ